MENRVSFLPNRDGFAFSNDWTLDQTEIDTLDKIILRWWQ
jgi:hypothetical protein